MPPQFSNMIIPTASGWNIPTNSIPMFNVNNNIISYPLRNIINSNNINIIPKRILPSIIPLLSRGYKILDGLEQLDLSKFRCKINYIDKNHFKLVLERNDGWESNINFILPLKYNLLDIPIRPKKHHAKLYVETPESLDTSGLGRQMIPRIIHQTFITDNVTKNMYNNCLKWIQNNPEYEYRYYDNDDCRKFIDDHFGEQVRKSYENIVIIYRKCPKPNLHA